MPKITRYGVTDRTTGRGFPSQEGGTDSSASSEKPKTSTAPPKDSHPSPVPTTESRSVTAPQVPSSARSTVGGGQATSPAKTTSPAKAASPAKAPSPKKAVGTSHSR